MLVESIEGRTRWLELLKAIADSLPSDPKDRKAPEDPKEDVEERNKIQITSLDCKQIDKAAPTTFLKYVASKTWYEPATPEEKSLAAAADDAGGGATPSATTGSGTGSGDEGASENPAGVWLIQLTGHHYHNGKKAKLEGNYGAEYVRRTLIRNLREGQIQIPNGDLSKLEWVSMKDLGIMYPSLIAPEAPQPTILTLGGEGETSNSPLPMGSGGGMRPPMGMGSGGGMRPPMGMMSGGMRPPMGMGSGGGMRPPMGMPGGAGAMGPGSAGDTETISVDVFDFKLQFIWQPTSPTDRKKRQEQAAAASATDTAGQAAAPTATAPTATAPGAPGPGIAPAAPGAAPAARNPAPATPSPAPATPGSTPPKAAAGSGPAAPVLPETPAAPPAKKP